MTKKTFPVSSININVKILAMQKGFCGNLADFSYLKCL